MDTLLLSPQTWDFVIDGSGNIALASTPYSLAQDAATYCRTFAGECYYNNTLGIPYWATTLGKAPPVSLIKQQFINQAKLVPGVVDARVFINQITDRLVTGQIQVKDTTGAWAAAGF